MSENEEIVAHIARTIDQAAPTPEQLEGLTKARNCSRQFSEPYRLNLLLLSVLYAQDTMRAHPDVRKETMLRLAAYELMVTSAFIIRSLKRGAGEELCPARFALVAYDQARQILQRPWASKNDVIEVSEELGSDIRKSVAEDRLQEIREQILALPGDEAIHVECVAQTLRNILDAGRLANLAFDLVDAERHVTNIEGA